MAAKVTHDQLIEEDYIDMTIIPSTNFLCSSSKSSSTTHSNEFEFQKNADLVNNFPATSPADDLFCNGKLLPLHLPPPFPTTSTTTTTTSKSILFDSFHLPCSISPSTSCYASQELNPEDYFDKSKSSKSLSKKIKLLKASTDFLKSLFFISTCSNNSFAAPKAKHSSPVQRKPKRKSTFYKAEEVLVEKRTSFSDTVSKLYSSSSSLSTSGSSSCLSSKPIGVDFVNSEVENLIQGAIAYCKMSQQSVRGKTTVSD